MFKGYNNAAYPVVLLWGSSYYIAFRLHLLLS